MDEQLYRVVRQRVLALVALFELEEDWTLVPMLELELRFGMFGDSGQFVAGLPNGLWYALFQYMSQAPTARIEASFSMVERDREAEDACAALGQPASVRVVHEAAHRECVRESKRALLASVDVPLFGAHSTAAVRVATSRETRLGDHVCAQRRPSDIPRFALRYRERRSVYLIQGTRSCWRFDFTRIDDKAAYELEIELDLREALLQTPGVEQAARTDAIMRQLNSLIVSLRHALEQADRVHRANVAQIVAKRQETAARLQQHL